MTNLEKFATVPLFAAELQNVIKDHPEISKDSVRLEGYLKDIYGSSYKNEIHLIVIAAKAKTTELIKKRVKEQSLREDICDVISILTSYYVPEVESAAWTIFVWAIGMHIMTEKDMHTILTEPKYFAIQNNNDQFSSSEIYNPLSNPIGLNPSGIDQLHESGLKLHNQGKYDEAIRCYDKALSINSQNYNILSDKGLSLHNQGKYDEAIRCYDKALSINSHDEFTIRRKINTMDLMNLNTVSYYNQIIDQTPNFKHTRKKINRFYVVGIMVSTLSLALAIIAYVIVDSGFNTDYDLSISQGVNYAANVPVEKNNSTDDDRDSKTTINQDLISEFTNSIEEQIILKETQSENFPQYQIIKENLNGDSLDNDTRNKASKEEKIDQKVDDFKVELEKAMESNFK
jgi:tetratricopeptide (TPR) repeat protein